MWRSIVMLLWAWAAFGVASAGAQSAAEYAGAVSVAGSAAARTPAPKMSSKFAASTPAQARSGAKPGSQFKHLPAPSGEPADVANRNELESRAGEDAGKLLLRSEPGKARIWVNGKVVGDTPLLLVLPPDRYSIEARGMRSGSARQAADLLPNETREIIMTLEQRYPTQVVLQVGTL
jgi:hypothetical protein